MPDNFDPDAYLNAKATAAPAFDPDAYLSAKAPKDAPSDPVLDNHVLNPKNIDAFLKSSRENIPVVSKLASHAGIAAGAGITSLLTDKKFKDLYAQGVADDDNEQAQREKDFPKASMLGAAGAGAYMPVPGAGAKGLAGAATRVAGMAGLSGADSLARTDGDIDKAKDAAKTGGMVGGALEAIPGVGFAGKKLGNAVFGVGEGATERYLANPQAVNSAKDFKGVTDDFLGHVDTTRAGLGADSKAGFDMLKGKEAPVEAFSSPVSTEIDRLSQMGTFSKESKQTLTKLQGLEEAIKGAATEDGNLPLEQGKALVMQLDDMIGKARATNAGTQELNALSKIRQSVDGTLKAASPEYKAHMAELAGDTEAAKGIADKFRSDNGAQNLLKRIGKGKDEYSGDALKAYDQRFGQNFSDDLQNSYAKQAFDQPTVNGSRRTGPGAAIGAAAGSAMAGAPGAAAGAALGTGIGAGLDKYGTQIWKAVLDGTLKVGPYAKYLEKAMQQGPSQVAMVHQLLMKQDPKYKALVEGQQQPTP